MTSQGLMLAALAGAFAANASVCAKLAMTSEYTFLLCQFVKELTEHMFHSGNLPLENGQNNDSVCEMVSLYIRVVFFGLVFVFNAVMWTLFVKSLQLCSTTIEATITNTASNLFFTAVTGHLWFGEALSLLWWTGISFVIAGMIFIQKGNELQNKKES